MRAKSLQSLGTKSNGSWRWVRLRLGDLNDVCGSDMLLSRRRWGATVGGSRGAGWGCVDGRCGRGGARGRGGGRGGGPGGGWVFRWGRLSVGGRFGISGLVEVHLYDVLLEVSDPVLLHRQRTVELHLAEPDADAKGPVRWDDATRNRTYGANSLRLRQKLASVVVLCPRCTTKMN